MVLAPEQTPEEGRSIAADLMEKLGIQQSDLIPCAYADLLLERMARTAFQPAIDLWEQ